ncbi:hypothetical protein HDR58_03375 [bacterium]|nr:hypothetical protein [bacterium]
MINGKQDEWLKRCPAIGRVLGLIARLATVYGSDAAAIRSHAFDAGAQQIMQDTPGAWEWLHQWPE